MGVVRLRDESKMIIGMDLDGVITKETVGWAPEYYSSCHPNYDTINVMKEFNKKGYKIIIYTSRLSNEVKAETIQWLNKYDVPYDAIHFDKPLYDFYIDDRGISIGKLKQLLLDDKEGGNGGNLKN